MQQYLSQWAKRIRHHPQSHHRVMALFMSLLVWNPIAVSAAAPTCVVKLKFSSDDKSDSATNAYVKQILTRQGYKIIDDWLFTIWIPRDYDVKIIITHTVVPNYGAPVSLMGMQLFIADSSGNILVDSYIDRANLEDNLRILIPACNTSPPSTPLPNPNADAVGLTVRDSTKRRTEIIALRLDRSLPSR
jgi:hypothetical protein